MILYRLIYKSDAAEYIDWTDLKDILLKSQENNAKRDITGILIMSDRKFLQVLEGPADQLNNLYAIILQDSRHKNSQLLSYTAIHERHFSEWAMLGLNISMMKPELKEVLVKKYGASGDGIAIPDDPFQAYSLLYDMYCNART